MQPILIIVGSIVILGWVISALRARLRRKRKLDQVLSSMHPAAGNTDMDQIKRLALAGQKIDAIKLYREIYGVGLKRAKDAVENLVEDLLASRGNP